MAFWGNFVGRDEFMKLFQKRGIVETIKQIIIPEAQTHYIRNKEHIKEEIDRENIARNLMKNNPLLLKDFLGDLSSAEGISEGFGDFGADNIIKGG